jgi:hypothetical protein
VATLWCLFQEVDEGDGMMVSVFGALLLIWHT